MKDVRYRTYFPETYLDSSRSLVRYEMISPLKLGGQNYLTTTHLTILNHRPISYEYLALKLF